jgi:3-hydroxyisobutyrate dehydrogenase-like beta-hydroxyacid dehydrogenase
MPERIRIGFIGVGAMGGPMVGNLLRGGYPVVAFDLNAERLAACVSLGARPTASAGDLVSESDFVLTSLPSSDAFVQMAEESILPCVRAGQTIIDLGTTTPPKTRCLAGLFAERGAALVDAPVSGGPGGAERADLLMFAAGEPDVVARCRPILETLTRPSRITYCGPSGAGQVVKGVNQLMMGLANAAYLEALAFGVRAGVDPKVIRAAVAPPEGFPGKWRQDFRAVADQVVAGLGDEAGVKFRELPYFLREAEAMGFELPLTETLYRYCEAGERVVIDDNRAAPSFWHELMTRGA